MSWTTASLMDTATLCPRLAAMPTVALGLIRAQVKAALERHAQETLALEASTSARRAPARISQEGVAAFLQKRKPEFKGK
jgi:2-(1,2-epoxy-1,2-dihydrophenyl)acetyl-CoA isomerase